MEFTVGNKPVEYESGPVMPEFFLRQWEEMVMTWITKLADEAKKSADINLDVWVKVPFGIRSKVADGLKALGFTDIIFDFDPVDEEDYVTLVGNPFRDERRKELERERREAAENYVANTLDPLLSLAKVSDSGRVKVEVKVPHDLEKDVEKVLLERGYDKVYITLISLELSIGL